VSDPNDLDADATLPPDPLGSTIPAPPPSGMFERDPYATFGPAWMPGDPLPRGITVDDIVSEIPNRPIDWNGFASSALDED